MRINWGEDGAEPGGSDRPVWNCDECEDEKAAGAELLSEICDMEDKWETLF